MVFFLLTSITLKCNNLVDFFLINLKSNLTCNIFFYACIIVTGFPVFSALTIKWIPFEVEQIILKLDERKLSANNWYPVARKLGLSMDETDNIRREECREGGSPTSALLSQLTTWQNVITLRRFVHVLHQLGRHDLSKLIFDFYRNREQQALTSSV